MKVHFRVKTFIQSPVETVFEALIAPEVLNKYYLKKASAPLQSGETVEWQWSEYEKQDLTVKEIKPLKSIHLEWSHSETGYPTQILINLEHRENQTMVAIEETGWKEDQESLDYAFRHNSAWTMMLLNLKAYLMFDVDLR